MPQELMIQANEVGKDYEHCLTLQAKLDDVNSVRWIFKLPKKVTEGFFEIIYYASQLLLTKISIQFQDKKVDESLLKQMKELAVKLSRKEDQKGVYIRYERICDR